MQDDQRLIDLQRWLRSDLGIPFTTIRPASGDASFRRYFRIDHNSESLIIMDAPPAKEDCVPFINTASLLAKAGLNVPRVLQQNLEQGYLLLSDLGTVQYLDRLNAETVDQLYSDALDALLRLQEATTEGDMQLPPYDRPLLIGEMELMREWYIGNHLNIELTERQHTTLSHSFEQLAQSALLQPQVLVHRDYHSRNLMVVDKDNPGVLDFQDAVIGAITYDLVSLLKDCYIAWPRTQLLGWVRSYHLRLLAGGIIDDVSEAQFIKWFDLMGAQRHLKVLGIFARLNIRDGKPAYLQDIPRTLSYLVDVCKRYEELVPLGNLLDEVIPTERRVDRS
ncbi:MAG TPA: aminoglycoside phosphotransferase [Chromatiales bacterium]|nr:aminoglycoside phosphotransferase [Chromatiales bacterium]